jgi:DNA-binding MarR family transcriptional regulator
LKAKPLNICLRIDISIIIREYWLVGVHKLIQNKEIFNVFFREKPAMMLLGLKNAKGGVYASSLAKSIDCTYSHVVKILQAMEKSGLINFEKQGRLKLLTLTKNGSDVADNIDKIRTIL